MSQAMHLLLHKQVSIDQKNNITTTATSTTTTATTSSTGGLVIDVVLSCNVN